MKSEPGIALVSVMLAFFVGSCGYTTGYRMPEGVHRISVPIFANETKNPEIARRLTNSFIEELLATGKVMVVDPDEAQAVIQGTVTRFAVVPITFDSDRKTTENRMEVFTDVSLFLAGETLSRFAGEPLAASLNRAGAAFVQVRRPSALAAEPATLESLSAAIKPS